VRRVRERVLAEHRDTVTGVVGAGTSVAATVETWPVTDPDRLRDPLEQELEDRDLLDPLLGVLDTAVGTLDTRLRGDPVAAPPYLVVTSRGPLCRATLADSSRLVVELSLFAVERRPRRYRFRDPTIGECLRVQRV
jgi:hypothetical protein